MAKVVGSTESIATSVVGVPVQSAVKLLDARPGRKAVVIAYPGSSFHIGASSAVTGANGFLLNGTLQIETEAEIWAYRIGGTGTLSVSVLETYDQVGC